jgi:hypothetical protein
MNRFSRCVSAEEVVFQAIGAGSMCWDPRPGSQVFDSTEAEAVGDEAMARLRELGALV